MKHILVVEDNEINQDLIIRRLKRKGYNVSLAEDGENALVMAKDGRPDLILLDMSLPKMDGWQVAKLCKDDQQLRDTPIIALTAHAMEGEREKALEAGCDEFETKPVDAKRLFVKIEELLKK